MRILIIGGTGRVGGAAARRLAGGEHEVRVMTRSAEKAAAQPEGLGGVVGDLSDPASLTAPLQGIEAVFMVTPLDLEETALGLAGVTAAREAGVRRFIYMSVHKAHEFPAIPHFASKVRIEHAVEESGMDYVILRPNSFFQNDLALTGVIREHGVYPHPLGSVGVNSVDVEDVAAAATTALTDTAYDGRTIGLVGPEVQTGEGNAATWARVLDRPVTYVGDLDAWEAQLGKFMQPRLAADVRGMYAEFQQNGFLASETDLADTRAVLGRNGNRYEEWVEAQMEK